MISNILENYVRQDGLMFGIVPKKYVRKVSTLVDFWKKTCLTIGILTFNLARSSKGLNFVNCMFRIFMELLAWPLSYLRIAHDRTTFFGLKKNSKNNNFLRQVSMYSW